MKNKPKKYWIELDETTYQQIEQIMEDYRLPNHRTATLLALANYMNLKRANEVARMKIEQLEKEIRRHEYQVDIFAHNLGKYLDRIGPEVMDDLVPLCVISNKPIEEIDYERNSVLFNDKPD